MPLVLADFFHQNASQSYLKTTNETELVYSAQIYRIFDVDKGHDKWVTPLGVR